MDKHKAKHSPPTFQPCALTQAIRHTLKPSRRTRRTVASLAVAGLVGLSNPAIAAFPASINLADLDGSNGFVLNGIDEADASGRSVSAAGDVNGDGIDDVIIGAFHADPYGRTNAGESYVVFGCQSGFPTAINLADLDGSNGFVINGIDAGDSSSWSVAAAGDINRDGLDDVIIGARNGAPNGKNTAGESYVVFGRSSGFPAALNLVDLDGSNGFVINGIDVGDRSGQSVSAAGDVNGDGLDDVIIGSSPFVYPGIYGAGESYVVFGSQGEFPAALNLADLDGSNGFVINGINEADVSGWSVSEAGDINGDGLDDVIIGARDGDPNGKNDAGESYVVFGRSTGFPAAINLSDLDGSNGFVINGIDAGDQSGRSVSTAGDVNGDGIDDVIIGASSADSNGKNDAGESYVVFGRRAGFPAAINLSDLDGRNGFVINGIDAYDRSGYSVSAAGDINGDEVDDVIIGAPSVTWPVPKAGWSYVVFGSSAGFPAYLNLADLDGSNGFVINGIEIQDRSGGSVSAAGDVNRDGLDDVIIGAYGATRKGIFLAGESYVVFGAKSVAFKPQLQSLGDINGDSTQDIAALVHDAAASTLIATVKDAENNSLISTVTFDGSLSPLRFIQLPDINSNGAPELVVLATGSVKAEVRDSLSGNLLSTVNFNPNITPVDIGVVPDRNANGIPELAVLGKHPTKGFVNVQTRDALTGNKIASTGFVPSFIPKQLLVLPDVDGNGMPEFAVLAVEDSADQFIKVEIRNFNGAPVRDIWLDQVSPDPLYMAMLEDMNGNGAVELATLRQKKDWVNVVVNDALSGAKLSSIGYNPNFAPLKLVVLPDLNGNGASELAVFGKNINTDGIKAEVRDASSGALIKDVYFWKVFTPQDLVTIPDISGNGKAELGMLGLRLSDGALRAYIKDVVTNTDIINVRF